MKLVDKVMVELQKLGLLPQKEEFGIVFKYQMVNYIYLDNDDEEYIKIYIPNVMDVEDEHLVLILAMLNTVNNRMKVVKLVVNEDQIWCCFEAKVYQDDNLADMIETAVEALYVSYQQFNDLTKEMLKTLADDSTLN